MPDLYQELVNLAYSDMYPFHMPGHKSNDSSTPLKGAFRCDITEIDDFDNLHDESGIILEAEKRANRLYGADETFFLVNGSTSGVLAAISAALGKNGTILAARGSHKSFYHAAYLRNLNIKYLPYRRVEGLDIPDSYTEKDIEENIDSSTEAVFITSPTYEGKCSNIREIAKVCHKNGIPLIVDAAHGAHFGFGSNSNIRSDYSERDNEYTSVPESAVTQGADLVIHSVHKTLPSMTQTALVHISGKLADKDRLKRFLRIYQSSSPSYILMASIDLCMKEMEENGDVFIKNLIQFRNRIQEETQNCEVLKVIGQNIIEDPSKVLISLQDSTMTGEQLYGILREEYRLQLEMASENSALAIISGWDTSEGIDRLIRALNEVDKRLSKGTKKRKGVLIELPQKEMSLGEAWDAPKEYVPFKEAEGRIAAEFVNLYPPGIPIIVPGEVYNREIIESIETYITQGLNVQGVERKKGFLCVKQK